jgi:hypothetical protein
LDFYQGDDPLSVVKDFCSSHGLSTTVLEVVYNQLIYQLNNNPTLIQKSNLSSPQDSQKPKRPPLSPKRKIHSSRYKKLLNQEQILLKSQAQPEQQVEVRNCYESLMSKKSRQVMNQTPWDRHHNSSEQNYHWVQSRMSQDFGQIVHDSDNKSHSKDSHALKRRANFSNSDSGRSDEIRKKSSKAGPLQDTDNKSDSKGSPSLKRGATFSMADSRRSDEISKKKLSQSESF